MEREAKMLQRLEPEARVNESKKESEGEQVAAPGPTASPARRPDIPGDSSQLAFVSRLFLDVHLGGTSRPLSVSFL